MGPRRPVTVLDTFCLMPCPIRFGEAGRAEAGDASTVQLPATATTAVPFGVDDPVLHPRVQPPPPSRWQAALGGRLHAPSPRPGFEAVDWAYHQQIVDLLVVGLRGSGNDIIVEVDLRSNDGRTARADIMGGKCGFDIACIEVKTSLVYDDDEQFTGDAFRRQQAAVLAQIPPAGRSGRRTRRS